MVTLTAFRSSKAGRKADRFSRRFTTWRGPVSASLIQQTGKVPAGRQHSGRHERDLHELDRRGGVEERSGRIRSSIRASTHSTTLVSLQIPTPRWSNL